MYLLLLFRPHTKALLIFTVQKNFYQHHHQQLNPTQPATTTATSTTTPATSATTDINPSSPFSLQQLPSLPLDFDQSNSQDENYRESYYELFLQSGLSPDFALLYSDIFLYHKVEWDQLPILDMEILQRMGIFRVGHQLRILKGISNL